MEIEGIKIPTTLEASGDAIALRGAGARKVLFFKPYLLAYYSSQAPESALHALEDNGEKAILLIVLTDQITGTLLAKGLRDGLDRTEQGRSERLKPAFDQLFAKFRDWPVRRGDELLITANGNGRVAFHYNTEEAFASSEPEMSRAVFGIWFSDKFPDKTLQRTLLGH